MQCDQERLQIYLDGELDVEARKAVEAHLGQCRLCRREISRLKLLWLELGPTGEADPPPELPYLRQQIISQALHERRAGTASPASYWEAQKLVWQPALLGASYIPGISLITTASRATVRQIPRLMEGTAALTRRLIFPSRDK